MTRRGRSLATTAALGGVLFALGAFTTWGNIQTTRATATQSAALRLDTWFTEARNAVSLEEMHARQYQLEPSVAARARYIRAAAAVEEALHPVKRFGPGQARVDAERLLASQAIYRGAADQLIEMVTDRDPAALQFDRLEVTPAYYTLQTEIDRVSRAYHSQAERQVADLRALQVRMLIGTVLGFAAGLTLVGVIWRVVLGYQRRLLEHADASQHLALHDPLTSLPNRTLFRERLDAALTALADSPDRQLAVMIIDLNGFKGVNDTLGHQSGDELLVEASRRLRDVLREGDTVARLGGDEFAVLLPTIPDLNTPREIAERLCGTLRRNFTLRAGKAAVSGSVGVVIGNGDTEAQELLRHADAAMYRAKTSGRGVAHYDPQSDIERPDRMALFADLRTVLDTGDPEGQLALHYQPQVRISDATVTAAEALVRWQHPERGLLMPGTFLPIAETGGLEIPLTYHLLGMAVREAVGWWTAGRAMVVAVNVSPQCLLDGEFDARVRATLAEHGLPASLLRLELTESTVMEDPDRALAVLGRVTADGVQVSVDDYGSGFSSLTQLKRLTADELKIDRSFIRDLAVDPEDAVLVHSAIELAHNLDLSVTAEGVEDLEALAMLRALGCDHAQGFALARPVPPEALAEACRRAEEAARQAPRTPVPLRDHRAVGR
jgi:diguanylate cyclase